MFHFTPISAVKSHECNVCRVFVSQERLCVIHVCMAPHMYDWLNTEDADMEKELVSCDVTTEVWMK